MAELAAFDFAVQQLVELGFSREHAERQVRTQLPHLTPPTPAAIEKDDRVREKEEQVEIRKLFIAYGFEVYVLSQPQRVKCSPGIPDLFAFHKREPFSTWWESKRQVGGRLSTPQQEFAEHCRRTCTMYGAGDRYALVEFLVQYQFAVRGAGQYGIEPIRVSYPAGSAASSA